MIALSRRFAVMATLLAALLIEAPAAWADPAGSFAVYGKNANGSRYQGQVEVRRNRAGEGAYDVAWRIGRERYTGIGLYNGQTFSVAYYGKITGVASYVEVNPGIWQGVWTTVGQGWVGEEIWER